MRPSRRHPVVASCAAFALLVSIIAPAAATARRGPAQVGTDLLARDSWIVTLVAGIDAAAQAPGLAHGAGGASGLVYRHALNGFQFKGSPAAAATLARDSRVASVQPDRAVYLNEVLPFGVERTYGYDPAGSDGAYQQGFRGSGSRIAILDTGIDLDHPDLVGAIDAALGKNCVNPGLPPDDGYGHGTHVAGTAAAPLNGVGVVGVAPEARLVAVKMFDDAGNSSEALALCAIDHIIGLNADADTSNDVDVANMSWGEERAWGDCASDALHGAICRAEGAGIIQVAGAGNAAADGGGFVPAAYPEVLSVSALADFDGQPGGLAGCGFVPELLWLECDDSHAFFSNYGPSVDVIAPGVQVYSTWTGGGWQTSSGTSMATPHISGIAGLMAAAAPGIAPSAARAALLASGECPNGQAADADGTAGCGGQGTWPDDPDGIAEPMGHALRAAQAVAPVPPPPAVVPPSAPIGLAATPRTGAVDLTWMAPVDTGGAEISGYEVYRGASSDTTSLLATIGPDLAYTDSGLTDGTTYWYRVAAINSAGVGDRSTAVAATPVGVPAAPTGLAAQKLRSAIQLTWSTPASDGGSPITGYLVRRTGGAAGPQTFEVTGAATLVYLDSSVTRATWYSYVVTAVNAVGEGPASNQVKVRSR